MLYTCKYMLHRGQTWRRGEGGLMRSICLKHAPRAGLNGRVILRVRCYKSLFVMYDLDQYRSVGAELELEAEGQKKVLQKVIRRSSESHQKVIRSCRRSHRRSCRRSSCRSILLQKGQGRLPKRNGCLRTYTTRTFIQGPRPSTPCRSTKR